jgi:hypothetical protein
MYLCDTSVGDGWAGEKSFKANGNNNLIPNSFVSVPWFSPTKNTKQQCIISFSSSYSFGQTFSFPSLNQIVDITLV